MDRGLAVATAIAQNPDCDGVAAAVAAVLAGEAHEREPESETACAIELDLRLTLAPDGTVIVEIVELITEPEAATVAAAAVTGSSPVAGAQEAEAEAEVDAVDGRAAAGVGLLRRDQPVSFA